MRIQQSFKAGGERKQYFDNTPLNISSNEFGIDDFRNKMPDGIRTQESYTIHIVLRGKGKFQLSDKIFDIETGMATITYPGIKIRFFSEEEDPLKYFWIMFNGDSALTLLEECDFSVDSPVFKFKDYDAIYRKINELNDEDMFSTDFRLKTLSTLLDILQHTKKERNLAPRKKKFAKTNYLMEITKCIESNFRNPDFKIADLSHMLNLSHSYICQLFKAHSTVTANKYLLICRIKEAQLLLEKTNKKIGSIASDVGFSDYSYFCKKFKDYCGRTPENYRLHQAKYKKE